MEGFSATDTSPTRVAIKHVQPPSPAFSTPSNTHGFEASHCSPPENHADDIARDVARLRIVSKGHILGPGHSDLDDVDGLMSEHGDGADGCALREDPAHASGMGGTGRRVLQRDREEGERAVEQKGNGTAVSEMRGGQAMDQASASGLRSGRAREAVDFGNTPGHKREGMKMVVASTSTPTIVPRQTKASLLRTSRDPLGSATNPRPTLRSSTTKARPVSMAPSVATVVPQSPIRASQSSDSAGTPSVVRARPTRPQSLYAPAITPRANKAALLRLESGGVLSAQGDQENKKGSPEKRAEAAAGLGRRRSLAVGPGSLVKTGLQAPRSTRASIGRAGPPQLAIPSTSTMPKTRSSLQTTPSSASHPPRSPLPGSSSQSTSSSTYGSNGNGSEPPRSTLDRYKVLSKEEQKRRDERLFENVPGHKKRQSMGPGMDLASLAPPRMAPRSNRAAALRRDPTLQYLPPPPPAFKARALPGHNATSVYSQRPASAMSFRAGEGGGAAESPRKVDGGVGRARKMEGSEIF